MKWADPELLSRWVADLDEVRFAALGNALLGQIAARAGIGRECLALNLRTKEPDGPFDSRCRGAAKVAGSNARHAQPRVTASCHRR